MCISACCKYSIKTKMLPMLDIGYFVKIAKINSSQEKPVCPNLENKFPQNTENRQSAKLNSRKNFVPHGNLCIECVPK